MLTSGNTSFAEGHAMTTIGSARAEIGRFAVNQI
jgi:hypothetical protein